MLDFWQTIISLLVGGGLVFFGAALGSGLSHKGKSDE